MRIHELAVVEQGSRIGERTSIWHHSHVREGAEIGEECTIGKNVFVDSEAKIGNRVKIQNNVSVYSGVVIEDEVFVGPSVVFTNDMWPRATSRTWQIVPTLVRSGASLGANSTLICGITIGRFALVGAGSVVTRDVEDHQLVLGNPASPSGWVCECGKLVSRETERPASLKCPECAQATRSEDESNGAHERKELR